MLKLLKVKSIMKRQLIYGLEVRPLEELEAIFMIVMVN